jgi:hypothetical protein
LRGAALLMYDLMASEPGRASSCRHYRISEPHSASHPPSYFTHCFLDSTARQMQVALPASQEIDIVCLFSSAPLVLLLPHLPLP